MVNRAADLFGLESVPEIAFLDPPDDETFDGDTFAIRGSQGEYTVEAARRRAYLYGAYEVLARERRGERVENREVISPATEMRGETEFSPPPMDLGPEQTDAWIEERLARFPWYRLRHVAPHQMNARNFLPYGYPDYEDPTVKPAHGLRYHQQVYEYCREYDLEFWYPIHVLPTPPETGYYSWPAPMNTGSVHPEIENVARPGPRSLGGSADLGEKFPEWFDEAGHHRIDNEGLWNMVDIELEAAHEEFPDMAGVTIWPYEVMNHSVDIRSSDRFEEIISRTLSRIEETIPDARTAISTHGLASRVENPSRENRVERKQQFKHHLLDEHPSLLLVEEINEGPQYPGREWFEPFETEEATEYYDGVSAATWVLSDGEHIGRNEAPFVLPGWYEEEWKVAQSIGVDGFLLRFGKHEFADGIRPPLEANVFVPSRLAWSDSDGNGERLLTEWLQTKYPPEAVEPFRDAFTDHEEIWQSVFMLDGHPVYRLNGNHLNDQLLLSDPGEAIRYPEILDLVPGDEWEAVAAEHERGIALAEAGLEGMLAVESSLSEERRDPVRAQERLVTLTKLTAQFVRTLRAEKQCLSEGEVPEAALVDWAEELCDLRDLIGDTIDTYDKNFFHGLPKGLAQYVWLSVTRIESLEDPTHRPISRLVR